MTTSNMDTTKNPSRAFVTLVTSEAYIIGAKVLAKSLRNVGTKYKIICLVTPNLPSSCLQNLHNPELPLFDEIRLVQPLDSKDAKNLALLGRPELGCTFTKIQVWAQADLEKVVFMDADMMVISNIDELFVEREEFSACPDVGWPDCFNSGLFVCRPDMETYNALLKHAQTVGSFDGGDQGLLNSFFSDWARADSSRRIPFGYNLTFSSSYSYLPALKHFEKEVKAIHFIGMNKPWTFHRFADGRVAPRGDFNGQHLEYIQQWWKTYDELNCHSSKSESAPQSPPTQHDYHVSSHANLPYQPPSPVSYGQRGQQFGNYKITWSNDVETYFSEIEVSSKPKSTGTEGEVNKSFIRKTGKNNP